MFDLASDLVSADPLSPTGEHAFYLVRTDPTASPAFGFAALYEYPDSVADTGLPAPFLGGHLETGGSAKEGGLGSVYAETLEISPCGRRFVFSDTDGRITVVTIPGMAEGEGTVQGIDRQILPRENDFGQPMVDFSESAWSPGGRCVRWCVRK